MTLKKFFQAFETKKSVNKVTAASKTIELQHLVQRSKEAEAKAIDAERYALFIELTSGDITNF